MIVYQSLNMESDGYYSKKNLLSTLKLVHSPMKTLINILQCIWRDIYRTYNISSKISTASAINFGQLSWVRRDPNIPEGFGNMILS